MPNVVSFADFVPVPRYDNVSWATVTIEESATPSAPWTLIDTLAISIDTDPSRPAPRSFTTDNALLTDGWYRITFFDINNSSSLPVTPVHRGTESALLPSLTEVGTIAMARTADEFGNVLGTFTASTRPNDVSARRLIERAAADVIPQVGTDIPEDLQDSVRNLIAIRAAMLIELTLYGQEVRNNLSPYPQYRQMYTDELERTKDEIAAEEAGGDPSDSLSGKYAAYSFPEPDNLLGGEL